MSVPEAIPRPKGHVLAADDDSVNKKLIVRLLKKAGYHADVVGNGAEAVEAVARVAYDAVFMDCQMPGMDGFEATVAIRAAEHGTNRHVPIIALTAGGNDADRERCLTAGMDDYLSKPIRPADLSDKLVRWIPATGRA